MQTLRHHRPSASMVVACLALFVALGGVGYAAVTINGKDILNETVTGKKLKDGTIAGTQVKRDGLGGGAIKESSLGPVPSAQSATTAGTAENATTARSADVAAKATTAESAAKASTADNALALGGVAAAQHLNGYEVVTGTSGPSVPEPSALEAVATCPAGKVVVGGGSRIDAPPDEILPAALQRDAPAGPATAPNQWVAKAIATSETAWGWSLTVTAICVNAP